jgi:DNA-binding NtrC family response regulator
VLLKDQWIPEKIELEAIKEILQLDNRVNIIFISADTSIKEEALFNSVFSFWEQPFTIKQLLNVIINTYESYNS